ncbi:MAG: DNA repair protein RecO [Firmicutes bacterium]|nr:DNA repair protein RecO [Bacillota bacterium]
MYTDTEGIILRQTKTMGGRRMLTLFSLKYGKISAGTGINERGKGKNALAMRPFTHGRYELFKNRDTYNINSAEVIRSYYGIGEDPDKYMTCAYILEFTEKLLPEEEPSPRLFSLLTEFFSVMEQRKNRFLTLVIAYQLKALAICGHAPALDGCIRCGSRETASLLDVKEGGIVCQACAEKYPSNNTKDSLIYEINFGIVNILRYFLDHPLSSFEKLALDPPLEKLLRAIIKDYIEYHLDVGPLKSEAFLPM